MENQPLPDQPVGTVPVEGAPKVWPEVPAVDGVVYGFKDPNHGMPEIVMAAMTLATWNTFAEKVKVLEARLANLSAENIELKQGRRPLLNSRILLPNG